jgi:thiamine-phosphate pyrophosphorylase
MVDASPVSDSTGVPANAPRNDRLTRLAAARLYLVCDALPGGRELAEVLPPAIAGGVEIVQLRVKDGDWHGAPRERRRPLLDAAGRAMQLCSEHGALFVVNDYPEVAVDVGADGVHVGQDDMPIAKVRALVGPDMLIGLSTHAPEEIDAADPALVDYIGVGPIHATPTKPGHPAVGVELVRYAAAHAAMPFFAIGGLDAHNVGEVLDAGASRVCVLRAVADAESPEYAAHELRRLLDAMPFDAPPIEAEGQT